MIWGHLCSVAKRSICQCTRLSALKDIHFAAFLISRRDFGLVVKECHTVLLGGVCMLGIRVDPNQVYEMERAEVLTSNLTIMLAKLETSSKLIMLLMSLSSPAIEWV